MSETTAKILDRILKVAAKAAPPESAEATTAAHLACEMLRKHESSLRGLVEAPASPQRSVVHPNAARHIQWRNLLRDHLREEDADEAGVCAACGDAYNAGDAVVASDEDPITHEKCKDWWRKHDFSNEPPF